MVYLVIKELADTAEDVIMVTSSVMKDVAGGGRGAGDQELYRANAIRALCRIIDVSWKIHLWVRSAGYGYRASHYPIGTSEGCPDDIYHLTSFSAPAKVGLYCFSAN